MTSRTSSFAFGSACRVAITGLAAALLFTACTAQPGPTLAEAAPSLEERIGAQLHPELPWDQPSQAWDGRAPLSAEAALTTALQNNRALRRSLLEIERRRARYQDSQLAPNPTLDLSGGVPLGMGVAPILAMVSAQVDWHWKREALVGETDAALRSALFQTAALTVATAVNTRAAYVDVASAWELFALSLREVEIATAVLQARQAAFSEGETTAVLVNEASMIHSEASIRAMDAHQSYETAQLNLLVAMGRGDDDTQWVVVAKSAKDAGEECGLQPTTPPLDHQELLDLVRHKRLDLTAAEARVTGAASRLALAKASQWPSVMLGGGWDRDMTGDDSAMFGASISVPIFNQGQFRVKAAEIELEMARLDSNALWQQAITDTRRALTAVSVNEHHIVQIRDHTLRAFTSTKALLDAGVAAGETAPLQVWQSDQQENRILMQLARARRDAIMAELNLQRVLAGTTLPGVVNSSGGMASTDASMPALGSANAFDPNAATVGGMP